MSHPDVTRPGLVAARPPGTWVARMTADRPRSAAHAAATLDALPTGVPAVVSAVTAPAAAPEWAQWLDELGFIPGERVMVTARGVPGGDPLVVRVGNSTFALRRAEAACIRLEPALR